MINGEWRQKSARTEDIKTIQDGTSQIQLVENDRIVQALTKSGVFLLQFGKGDVLSEEGEGGMVEIGLIHSFYG